MKKLTLLFILFWMKAASCDGVSEALQMKLNAIRTMSASFTEVVNAKQRQVSNSSGTMALSRPGRFRWQTVSPMAQLVVADGHHLWMYDVDLEQVTVKKQDQGLGGTAALFLTNDGDTVTRDFDVKTTKEGSKEIFDLHSKSNKANFQHVKLLFSNEILSGIELFDQLGQHTVVRFTRIKNNPQLAANLFKFKTPKGVDVVAQ